MDKYNAAYINALSEERDPKILFDWVVRLHKENVDLRLELKKRMDEEELDYTEMWDEIKNEWNIELFYDIDEDETEDEEDDE